MEPMTLGSPSSSSPSYLPSFLLGDQASPDKSRNPLAASPPDSNRSALGQKVLFSVQSQQTPSTPTRQNQDTCKTGPPTMSLFDSLRNDLNQVPESGLQSPNPIGTPVQVLQNVSAFAQNVSINPYNDSYSSFNGSRSILSPLGGHENNTSQLGAFSSFVNSNNFWVTVFGFPPSSSTAVLQHFTNCGTIVDKIFAPQNGNWMHIKFLNSSECARALNYNEKILFNNIMIGVTECREKSILEKENLREYGTPQHCRARHLTQSVYKPQADAMNSPISTLRPSGIVNKAMELFFNW